MKKKTILHGLQMMKSKRLIILNLLMTTWEENLLILTSLIPPPQAVAAVPLPFQCKCNLDSGKLQDRHEICVNLVPLD